LFTSKVDQLFSLHNFLEAMASSGKTDKSPHDQEIKFFAKVAFRFQANTLLPYAEQSSNFIFYGS